MNRVVIIGILPFAPSTGLETHQFGGRLSGSLIPGKVLRSNGPLSQVAASCAGHAGSPLSNTQDLVVLISHSR